MHKTADPKQALDDFGADYVCQPDKALQLPL